MHGDGQGHMSCVFLYLCLSLNYVSPGSQSLEASTSGMRITEPSSLQYVNEPTMPEAPLGLWARVLQVPQTYTV